MKCTQLHLPLVSSRYMCTGVNYYTGYLKGPLLDTLVIPHLKTVIGLLNTGAVEPLVVRGKALFYS